MRYVYGPVPSRRLGFSLGIDIVPYKTCTLDCIYCQLGRTTRKSIVRKMYTQKNDVLGEVKEVLDANQLIDYITFSGSGEPTLNSDIGGLIREIKEMTSTPLAVLTNGTLLFREDVQKDLLRADMVLPSLDAASFEMFQKINRPHRALKIDLIIDGLKRFREIYKGQILLEIMLIKGFNDDPQELSKIKKVVSQIMPDKIHLNTVIRPPSEMYAEPLNIEEMTGIKEFFGKECEVIGEFHAKARKRTEDIRLYTLETIKRRPLTTIDIANIFGISESNTAMMIERLKTEGVVTERRHGTKKYYIFSKIKDRITIH
jgi:wyosine [tRNA(Phe)-imidazoG37] synthetase (radical SAM superfamily)